MKHAPRHRQIPRRAYRKVFRYVSAFAFAGVAHVAYAQAPTPVPTSTARFAEGETAPAPSATGSAEPASSAAPADSTPAPVPPNASTPAPAAAPGAPSTPPGTAPPPIYGPPPGAQGYPPPAGWPQYYYPQYYPPPGYRAHDQRRMHLRYPEDRAVRTTPFLDFHTGAVSLTNRFSNFMIFSVQPGAYIAKAVRIAGRIGVLVVESDRPTLYEGLPEGFVEGESPDAPSVLFGGSAGYVLVSTPGFVLSPGILFLTTDVGALGSAVGVNLPFEWVSRRSMRIGFEIAGMASFGGSVRATCEGFSPMPTCDPGEVRDFDRPSGGGFYMAFQLGWGLSAPKPERVPEGATVPE